MQGSNRTLMYILFILLALGLLMYFRDDAGDEPSAGPSSEQQENADMVDSEDSQADADLSDGTGTEGDSETDGDSKSSEPAADEAPSNAEIPVQILPLAEGDFSDREAEYSSLTWFGYELVMLPQYPGLFDAEGTMNPEGKIIPGQERVGSIFVLERGELMAAIDGDTTPLVPRAVPIEMPAGASSMPGYEGFEAIAFDGTQAYLTIEADGPDKTQGFAIRGEAVVDVNGALERIVLDADSLLEIDLPVSIDNMSLESMTLSEEGPLTFFEANGNAVNPQALAWQLDQDLTQSNARSFPNIEYRVTDATAIDEAGQFWVINYFFPGEADKLVPQADQWAEQFGEGETHAQFEQVERIIGMHYTDGAVVADIAAPIQLELVDAETARNWEGIARMDDQGWLLVTDKFPETQLGFVSAP